MPLHKLSQWLAYSLIEPLENAGMTVVDVGDLTGLAEYRNGGLFVDMGVLVPRDGAAFSRTYDVSDPFVVGWRSADRRVARRDRAAGRCATRARARRSFRSPRVLEGGTWAAGRLIARERRADGGSTLSDLERWDGVLMNNVTVVEHPLVQHKLTLMRDKTTSTKGFRQLLREIATLLCYEVTRDLPLDPIDIETPLMPMRAQVLSGKKLVFAPILRAGMGLLEGMLDLVPSARVAHIGLYRDPESLVAVEYYFKAPTDLAERVGHRRRSHARHRQHGGRRDRSPQGAWRQRVTFCLSARHRAGIGESARAPSRRCGCGPRRSMRS